MREELTELVYDLKLEVYKGEKEIQNVSKALKQE